MSGSDVPSGKLPYIIGGAVVGFFLVPRLIAGASPFIGAAGGAGVGYLAAKELKKEL